MSGQKTLEQKQSDRYTSSNGQSFFPSASASTPVRDIKVSAEATQTLKNLKTDIMNISSARIRFDQIIAKKDFELYLRYEDPGINHYKPEEMEKDDSAEKEIKGLKKAVELLSTLEYQAKKIFELDTVELPVKCTGLIKVIDNFLIAANREFPNHSFPNQKQAKAAIESLQQHAYKFLDKSLTLIEAEIARNEGAATPAPRSPGGSR